MDTARDLPCQPGPVRMICAGFAVAAGIVLMAGGLPPAARGGAGETPASEVAPAPSPQPPWRRDLDGLFAARVAAGLTPDKADAGGNTAAEHLAESYREVAARYPAQPEVQRACGDYFYETGDIGAAVGYWLRAQELNPGDARLAADLGETYLGAGNMLAAAVQFQRAVDARPEEAAFHTSLANVLYLFRKDLAGPLGLPDAEAVLLRALEHFRLAASLAPADRGLAQGYAETFYLLAKPDWARALGAWQAVLALSGGDPDFANLQLARVSLRMGQPREAEMYLDRLKRPEFAALQAKLRGQAKAMAGAQEREFRQDGRE